MWNKEGKRIIWGQKELQEFVDASFFLAKMLEDIPGASDALMDYSKKLAKLIVKQSQPGISTSVSYCEQYFSDGDLEDNVNE